MLHDELNTKIHPVQFQNVPHSVIQIFSNFVSLQMFEPNFDKNHHSFQDNTLKHIPLDISQVFFQFFPTDMQISTSLDHKELPPLFRTNCESILHLFLPLQTKAENHVSILKNLLYFSLEFPQWQCWEKLQFSANFLQTSENLLLYNTPNKDSRPDHCLQ